MEFNVAQLLQQPVGASRQYTIDEIAAISDPHLDLIGPIRGEAKLLRTQRGILVTATLQQRVRTGCVRCLADMELDIPITIEEEFVPSVDLRTGLQLTWTPEDEVDEAQIIDKKHTLSLLEVARQELLLALPPHPLCSESCAGICPICGANLNEEPCNCADESLDPRWAALAAFQGGAPGE
jgi:uncharacterized protein